MLLSFAHRTLASSSQLADLLENLPIQGHGLSNGRAMGCISLTNHKFQVFFDWDVHKAAGVK